MGYIMAASTDRVASLLYRLPRVGLNNIADLPGAKKKAIRVGRGPGSRRGKTCGRGHKGQGQRGTRPRVGFEGGQTPFYLRIPKHGFKNKFRCEYEPLNLSKLQLWIDSGRIDPDKPINMYTLHQAGVVGRHIKHGVKLLGGGAEWFQSNIDIEVSRASKSAIDAVERSGGRIVSAHYNKLGLRVLLKPEKFEGRPLPRRALPGNKLLPYYMDYTNRGYLSEELADSETRERVLGITNRKKLPRRPKGWQAIESERVLEESDILPGTETAV